MKPKKAQSDRLIRGGNRENANSSVYKSSRPSLDLVAAGDDHRRSAATGKQYDRGQRAFLFRIATASRDGCLSGNTSFRALQQGGSRDADGSRVRRNRARGDRRRSL